MEQNAKTIDFITKAQKVHNTRYDYSKVQYEKSTLKVIITCLTHGDFYQTQNNHLNTKGCSKCGYIETMKKLSLTKEQFIEKARQVHGNTYNYHRVVYVNSHTKVIITCLIHGDFEQTPASHCNLGNGCARCGDMKTSEKLTLTNEKFIEKSKKIHGDLYDYNKVAYVHCYKKVTIICQIHGEFVQTPASHLNGHGCQKCANKYFSELFKLTTEQFIERSRLKHDNRYDYRNVNYINSKIKVKIICTIHGEFEQSPANHLRGNGCPHCCYKT